jgi:hypothetical protein
MAYEQTTAETAAIGLIDQHSLVRSLSPELMLVDPELAEQARELLREPHEANGKGHMSALGTHEITAGTSLGVEPPLSPPVVRGPVASAAPAGDGLSGLPTPPPAIRPPESATPVAAPVPAPAPHAEVPQQQPGPVPAPAPVQEAAPVLDYFAGGAPAVAPVEAAPVAEAAPAPEVEVHTAPLMAPAPVEEPVELPAVEPAPQPAPQPAPEPQPAAAVAPQPVELAPLAPAAPEPVLEAEPADVQPVVVEQPVAIEPEPVAAPEPVLEAEPAELFTPVHSDFRVLVRLRECEGVVEVGSFRDFGTAMEGAQEVIEQFSTATEGRWPFYAGRFIRPDLIVSVDVVEGEDA